MQKYPEGVDCIWIGTDNFGNVGAFITAGLAPLPMAALRTHLDIEVIGEEVMKMPVITGASVLVPVKRPDEYLALAGRGFFVYDWTDISRVATEEINAYELAAVPVRPIDRSALPYSLSESAVELEPYEFGEISERIDLSTTNLEVIKP